MTFLQFISEHFNNLFNAEQKAKYAPVVWDMLQAAYAPIGGLKGSGFRSPQDMIENIPMWKVATRNGVVKAVILYKDRNGRKLIAVATDGSFDSKDILLNMLKADFSRSYAELSGPLLMFIKRRLPELVAQYAIPAEQVAKIAAANGKTIIPVNEFEYTREINGHSLQKMMIGTVGKSIE